MWPSVSCEMIQRAAATDQHLHEITRALVENARPTRIILFGSRARGDARDRISQPPDYNFLAGGPALVTNTSASVRLGNAAR